MGYLAQVYVFKLQTDRRRIVAVYKRPALRVISAFRTFYTDAVMVTGETGLVHTTVDEARRKHFARRRTQLNQLDDSAMQYWQHAWSISTKGN